MASTTLTPKQPPEEESEQRRDLLPNRGQTSVPSEPQNQSIERVIPLVSEKLETTKKPSTDYVIIRKIPVREMKTIEVPITYEKVIVERRPGKGQRISDDKRFQSAVLGGSGMAIISSSNGDTSVLNSVSEIVIPVLREEVEVKKRIVVTDEVIVSKKLVSGFEKITEQLKGETISTEAANPKIVKKAPREIP